MPKHIFVGKVHSVKESRAFCLMNDGDYFGASIFPSRSQLAKMKAGDVVAVKGNVRQTEGKDGGYMTSISVPKGESLELAVQVGGKWNKLVPEEADDVTDGYNHSDLPF